MSIEEKLVRTRFLINSGHPHLRLDAAKCRDCDKYYCISVCPADCYRKDKNGVVVSWENCMECGSCRIVCPYAAIEWNYPEGGFGICYRFG